MRDVLFYVSYFDFLVFAYFLLLLLLHTFVADHSTDWCTIKMDKLELRVRLAAGAKRGKTTLAPDWPRMGLNHRS